MAVVADVLCIVPYILPCPVTGPGTEPQCRERFRGWVSQEGHLKPCGYKGRVDRAKNEKEATEATSIKCTNHLSPVVQT